MKREKMIGLVAFLAATSLLFTGCVGLGDIVFGLSDMVGASQSTPAAPSSSVAAPQSSAVPAPSDAPAPAPEPVEEAKPVLALNADVVAFMGKTNGDVRAVNGDVCGAYIMYGGSPVADYMDANVPYPFAFWLDASQADMMDVWSRESDGAGNAPDVNFWPDSYPVGLIEAWGDSISTLFGTDSAVTYDMLAEAYGQSPELYFTAAGEGVNYSYSIDTWEAEYQIEGFRLYAVFSEENDEKALFLLRLQR